MAVDDDPKLRQILLGLIRNQTFLAGLMLDAGVIALDDLRARLSDLIEADRRSGATVDELFASEALLDMVARLSRPPLDS